MSNVYVITTGMKILGVFSNQSAADEAAQKLVWRNPDIEYNVEEWPLNQLVDKFNVMVVSVH